MREHIYWQREAQGQREVRIGPKPPGYTAWYQDEGGKKGPVARGATKEQALEAVHQKLLTQKGRVPSTLPKPERHPYHQG